MPPKVAQWIIEQEEQKILKQFEEKGYKGSEKIAYGRALFIERNYDLEICVYISKKEYKTRLGVITVELHQLLHKLFELWGWFDE